MFMLLSSLRDSSPCAVVQLRRVTYDERVVHGSRGDEELRRPRRTQVRAVVPDKELVP